jgi:hypothetical protein
MSRKANKSSTTSCKGPEAIGMQVLSHVIDPAVLSAKTNTLRSLLQDGTVNTDKRASDRAKAA